MADAPAEPATSAAKDPPWLEIAVLALMSTAGLAGTWSSYQSTRWSAVQTRSTAEVGGFRTKANRAAAKALAQQSLDVQMFVRWLEADGRDDAQAQRVYREQFRAEFKPAFLAWEAERARRTPGRPATPFETPAYRLAESARAAALDQQADTAAARARGAVQKSVAYVQVGVIFALVLFLTGMAQTFRRPRLRVWLVAAAALAFVIGVVQGLRLPVA